MGLNHKPNYIEFMNALYMGKYHNCDLSYIIEFMRTHKDTYILIDGSHEKDPALYTKKILEYSRLDTNIIDRLIFEISSNRVFEIIDSLHHFKNYMYAGVDYRKVNTDDIIIFCKEHGIPAVSTGSIALTKDVIKKYNDNGIKVYAYSINDGEEVMNLLKDGVWGIYTDLQTPSSLQEYINNY